MVTGIQVALQLREMRELLVDVMSAPNGGESAVEAAEFPMQTLRQLATVCERGYRWIEANDPAQQKNPPAPTPPDDTLRHIAKALDFYTTECELDLTRAAEFFGYFVGYFDARYQRREGDRWAN